MARAVVARGHRATGAEAGDGVDLASIEDSASLAVIATV